jgi:spore coat-associated protein N
MPARSTARTTARLTLIVAACALLVGGVLHDGTLNSTALLTDNGSTSAATVATGSVSLSLSSGASSGSWTGAVSMKPGDTVYRRLTVSNVGATRIRYAIAATTSSALSAKLVMNVAVIAASSSCTSVSYAEGTLVSGADLTFGASPDLNVIGDPAPGAQAGDRQLDAAASDDLCMQLTFPTGTHLGYAGRGTTAAATFIVSGENA